jgi:hypothetical protein
LEGGWCPCKRRLCRRSSCMGCRRAAPLYLSIYHLCVFLSIHLCIYRLSIITCQSSIHPSFICLSMYLSSIYPSSIVYLSIHLLSVNHLSIHPSIIYRSSICPFIHLSLSIIYLPIFIYVSIIYPTICHLSICPSVIYLLSIIHPSIHPSIIYHQSIDHLSIHPSFIYLSIYLSSFLQCWGWNPGPQACSWCTSTTILPP